MSLTSAQIILQASPTFRLVVNSDKRKEMKKNPIWLKLCVRVHQQNIPEIKFHKLYIRHRFSACRVFAFVIFNFELPRIAFHRAKKRKINFQVYGLILETVIRVGSCGELIVELKAIRQSIMIGFVVERRNRHRVIYKRGPKISW